MAVAGARAGDLSFEQLATQNQAMRDELAGVKAEVAKLRKDMDTVLKVLQQQKQQIAALSQGHEDAEVRKTAYAPVPDDEGKATIYQGVEPGDMDDLLVKGSAYATAAPSEFGAPVAAKAAGGGSDDQLPQGNPFNLRAPSQGKKAEASPALVRQASDLKIDVENCPGFFNAMGRSEARVVLQGQPVSHNAQYYLFRLCGDPEELIDGKPNPNLFVLTFNDPSGMKNIKIFRFPGEGLAQTKDKSSTVYRTVDSLVKAVVGPTAKPALPVVAPS